MADSKAALAVVENQIDDFQGYRSEYDYEFFENFNSEHTKKAYKNDLRQFSKFVLQTFGKVSSIERSHVIAFRNFLQTEGGKRSRPCCPKSVIRKMAAITSYCDFLIEKGFLRANPTANIKRPRDQVVTETNGLTDEQVKKLWSSVDVRKKSGYLHRAILGVFFSTGIRKSSLINLNRSDYREKQGFKIIQIYGKGGKVSLKPLHPTASFYLEEYIRWMASEGRELSPDDPLFQPTRNRHASKNLLKRMQPVSINYVIKTHCEKIGIEDHMTSHSARVTVISSLLDDGCDIYKVSQFVDHENVQTTQGYDKRRKRLSDCPVFQLKYF